MDSALLFLMGARSDAETNAAYRSLKLNMEQSEKMSEKTKTSIRLDSELVKIMRHLKVFYGCKDRSCFIRHLVMICLLNTAKLKPRKDWTRKQRSIHREMKKHAITVEQLLMLKAAKEVLKKQKPGTKMTVNELMEKSKKYLKRKLQNASS